LIRRSTRQVMGWMETVVEASSGDGVKVGVIRNRGKTGTSPEGTQWRLHPPEAGICQFRWQGLRSMDPRYVVSGGGRRSTQEANMANASRLHPWRSAPADQGKSLNLSMA